MRLARALLAAARPLARASTVPAPGLSLRAPAKPASLHHHRGLSTPSRSTMSNPKYRYISADDLAALLKSEPEGAFKSWAVIDVRDSDFAGGNIVGAANYPSEVFLAEVDALVRRAENVPVIVFHCALSQVRGPKAARRYAEAREAQLKDAAPAQEILVLRQGFEGFQSRYRDDKALVEKFNKFYHD